MCVCVCVCVRERERERERGGGGFVEKIKKKEIGSSNTIYSNCKETSEKYVMKMKERNLILETLRSLTGLSIKIVRSVKLSTELSKSRTKNPYGWFVLKTQITINSALMV